MKERPIIFTGESVLAILEGRKTQTRRMVKPEPPVDTYKCGPKDYECLSGFPDGQIGRSAICCPYGRPGDRLWVRETWYPAFKRTDNENGCVYKSDYGHRIDLPEYWSPNSNGSGWKNSMFMPRWASRITLEITGVRVERVQEISEADAIAEGCRAERISEDGGGLEGMHWKATAAYMKLWDSINAKRGFGWDKNPWVWVIEFKRM